MPGRKMKGYMIMADPLGREPALWSGIVDLSFFLVWKPWAGAYAGEKGKNLARKEDLDKILLGVRTVTATQKEIEAKISGELWDRQMHRTEKKDLYVRLAKNLMDYASASDELLIGVRN